MELLPNEGIGDIRFGMTPSAVRAIMGDKLTYEGWWMDGNLNDCLYYPGIVLPFDKNDGGGPLDDGRLIEAWIHKSFYVTFKGIEMFGKSIAFIEELLQQLGVTYEIYGTYKASRMDIKEYGWELYFKETLLTYIKIFCRN